MADFLDPNYREPETSNYMKLKEGNNRFRVLGSTITGYEYWVTEGNKRVPKRVKLTEKVPVGELEVNPKTNEVDMPKVFWAFPVWNYKSERIQILELKQKTIRDAIRALVNNKKWGDPKEYDIVVTRDDSSGKTKYPSIQADPKDPIAKEITDQFKSMYLDLNKLYDGKNPFINDETVDPDEVNI